MTKKSNELIEQYLYDVVRRLPEKQRKDIEQELGTLIEDMIEERMEREEAEGGGYTGNEDSDYEKRRTDCVKAVLSELGNPSRLARSYRGENAGLISGEYYDSYCFVLRIVLICVGAGIIISGFVSTAVHVFEADMLRSDMREDLWNNVVNIGNLPMALVQAFGIVTLIYAIMERNQVKISARKEAWTLAELPQIPYKKAVIGRGDCVAGIVFSVLAAIMFIAVPQLMGAWVIQDDVRVSIPIFNLAIWNQVLPLFIMSFIAGIVDESVKLAAGRYNYTVMTVNIVSNMINAVCTVIIFKFFPIWNINFGSDLRAAFEAVMKEVKVFSLSGLLSGTGNISLSNMVICFVIMCCLLDIGITVYRTLRYGGENR